MVSRATALPESPQACPISDVVDVLLSRWTTPILWTLYTCGRLRFTDLAGRVDAISPKVLTQRLRQLERDGLVTRTYFAEVPPRVEYEITALGASLADVFAHLTAWGEQHMPSVTQARARFDAAPPPGRGH